MKLSRVVEEGQSLRELIQHESVFTLGSDDTWIEGTVGGVSRTTVTLREGRRNKDHRQIVPSKANDRTRAVVSYIHALWVAEMSRIARKKRDGFPEMSSRDEGILRRFPIWKKKVIEIFGSVPQPRRI